MGASASVERSPLSFRASLLVRYHASGSHRRTLAQAVYSGLYQAVNAHSNEKQWVDEQSVSGGFVFIVVLLVLMLVAGRVVDVGVERGVVPGAVAVPQLRELCSNA